MLRTMPPGVVDTAHNLRIGAVAAKSNGDGWLGVRVGRPNQVCNCSNRNMPISVTRMPVCTETSGAQYTWSSAKISRPWE